MLLFFALSCARKQGTELRWSDTELTGLQTAFHGTPPDVALSAEQLSAMPGRCPTITRARFEAKQDPMGIIQVWGQGLERVERLAALKDGPLGESPPRPEADGSLRFALGCRDCQLVLSQTVDGVRVGCLGPGYSLRLVGGLLVRE